MLPSLLRWIVSLSLLLLAQVPALAADARLEKAHELLNARLFAEAAEVFTEVADAKEPSGVQRAEANLYLGISLQSLKRFEAAIERYTLALASESIAPADRVKANLEYGYCLRRLGKTERALAKFQLVEQDLAASPTALAQARLNGSSTYLTLEEPEKAIEQLQAVTRQADALPHYRATAWLSLGRIRAAEQDFDAARKAYQAALAEGETGTKSAAARNELIELELLSQPDTALFMLPWLTRVSQRDARLHWVAKGSVAEAEVLVEDADGATVKTVKVQQLAEIKPGFFLYEAELRGLSPGRTYRYKVIGPQASADGRFVTADPSSQELTFCVLGDTQSRADVHTEIAKLLAAQQPEFVLHCGDCVERGTDWLQWQTQLFGPGRPYLELAPLYPARGNHDGGSYFPRFFGLLENQYYSFDRGLVHVAALDAFGPGSTEKALKVQAVWLDQDLGSSKAPWKVVFMHNPMVNGDLVNDWWALEELMPILEKHGVAVAFSGHHHRYRRFLPLHPPGQPDASPTWHITTGGSGGTISGHFTSPLTMRTELVHHFLRVDVTAEQMRIKAIDIAGKQIDEIMLHKKGTKVTGEGKDLPVDRAVAERIVTFFTHLSPYKQADVLTASLDDDQLVINFDNLPSGVLDTSEYPADFQVRVSAAEDSLWKITPVTVPIRGAREIRVAAQPPAGSQRSLPPLRITLAPSLGERALIPQTFHVQLTADE